MNAQHKNTNQNNINRTIVKNKYDEEIFLKSN